MAKPNFQKLEAKAAEKLQKVAEKLQKPVDTRAGRPVYDLRQPRSQPATLGDIWPTEKP